MKRLMSFVVVGGVLSSSAMMTTADDRPFFHSNSRTQTERVSHSREPGRSLRAQPALFQSPLEAPPLPAPGQEVPPEGAVPYPAQPYPSDGPLPPPGPRVVEPHLEPAPAFPLYDKVVYRREHKAHPCAVPTVVPIPDPCATPHCPPRKVYIKICVPPDIPPRVKVSKCGKIYYNYGKHRVRIKSKGDVVEVKYDTSFFRKMLGL